MRTFVLFGVTNLLCIFYIINIQNYIISTTDVLYNQRIQDWTFYQNSQQVNQDVSFLQQFNNMGGTMSYLVKNVIGNNTRYTILAFAREKSK